MSFPKLGVTLGEGVKTLEAGLEKEPKNLDPAHLCSGTGHQLDLCGYCISIYLMFRERIRVT